MLAPYRVVDLSDRDGWLAGFLLAQLGAEVILVEPQGGYPRDAWFEAYNRGKRSVFAADDSAVAELAASADVVICNRAPMELDILDQLRASDPSLVTLSLTPFGRSGPKSDWLATDLTLAAASGQMSVTGDADRPPVRTSLPQAWMHACCEGVVGVLVALHERARSGLGQDVDASVQSSMLGAALPSVLNPPSGLPTATRSGGGVVLGTLQIRWVYPASDGHVVVSLAFGPMIGPFTRRLIEWMHEEGMATDDTFGRDYVEFALMLQSGEYTLDEFSSIMDEIEAFTATKSKAELAEAASARSLLIVPVFDLDDVLDNPQLEARGYWDTADGVRHPGPMVKASATPLPTLGPAPKAGQHQSQFVGVSLPSLVPVPAPTDNSPSSRPLEGLKVLDLAWVAAMPLATRILAHWGATVVRIESEHRPDVLRAALGHRDDIPEQENAIMWHAANAGKMGVALNLAVPEAREVVRDLVPWADVVTESFTPGTMASLGFGYEDLREINPSIVMLSSCVMGQTGPMAGFAGFGNLAAAVAGFFDLTGWPDRAPAGPYMAYTDFTSPRLSVMAILAAIDHQHRTGEGQYLDFSQIEAATHFLTPALLDRQRHETKLTRAGNHDPDICPHSVYPAAGEDRWIAVVCETDEQWQALAHEMRRDDLGELSLAERLEQRDLIDGEVAGWTQIQEAAGLTSRLQAHGVPAHLVSQASDTWTDPQLTGRGQFIWVDHPTAKTVPVDNPPHLLSRSPGSYQWAGPTYGQHTYDVLQGILGYDADKIADLAAAEALE